MIAAWTGIQNAYFRFPSYRLQDRSGSTNYLTITSSWLVGIGTNSPSTRLTVNGWIYAEWGLIRSWSWIQYSSSEMMYSSSGWTYFTNTSGNYSNGITANRFNTPNTMTAGSFCMGWNCITNWRTSQWTDISAGLIYTGWSVGINITPANRLHVSGNIGATWWIGAGCEGACDSGWGYSILRADGEILSTNSVRSPLFIDSNNTDYYVNPAGASITNDMRANIFYDQWNTNYYLDPNSISILNDIRPTIIYDRNNTNYYLDPNNTSAVSALYRTYGFNGVEYDGNNTNYYIDLNGTSRLNYGVYDNLYSYGWMQTPIFYDANNNGYYLDPNNTSSLVNIYAYNYFYHSDDNLKTNKVPLKNPLEKLKNITGYSYNWKDSGEASIWVIAQEVEKEFPELVSTLSGSMSVNYGGLIAPVIEAIKDQQSQIDLLKKEIEMLKNEVK